MIALWRDIRHAARGLRRAPGFTLGTSLSEAMHEWSYNSTFCNEAIQRIESFPGVMGAGAVMGLPLSQQQIPSSITVEGRPLPEAERPTARIRVISDNYFLVMGIPLRGGRHFTPADSRHPIGHTDAAIINATMARELWPNENALGKRFSTVAGDERGIEVIGIVGDVRYGGLDTPVGYDVYFPERLFPQAEITLVVRTEDEPRAYVRGVAAEILAANDNAIITDTRTMTELSVESVAGERFAPALFFAFSAVALSLAAAGLYALVSIAASLRRRELAIRSALGAERRILSNLILRRAVVSVVLGLSAGVLLSHGFARLLASVFVSVSAAEGTTLLVSVLPLAGVAVIACSMSAWKAMRAEPASVLQHD
jgi:putative ABC transport system permease protein